MNTTKWSFRTLIVLIAVAGVGCKGNGGGGSPNQTMRQTVPQPGGPGQPPGPAGQQQGQPPAGQGQPQQGGQQGQQQQDGQPTNVDGVATGQQQGDSQAGAANNTAAANGPSQDAAVNEGASATEVVPPKYEVRTSANAPGVGLPSTSGSAAGANGLPSVWSSSTSNVVVPRVMGYARTADLVLPNRTSNQDGQVTKSGVVGKGGTLANTSDLVVSSRQAPQQSGISQSGGQVQTSGQNQRGDYQETGWPQGYAPSASPLYTGMVDAYGQHYTDAKNDSIMAAMVEKMNKIESQIRADSEQLAMAVDQINLTVDQQVMSLNLVFKFTDREINENFSGYLQGSQRTTQLQQRTNQSGEKFQVQATCADQDNQCRNVILTIDQIKEGRLCRRIYAVHRWMITGVGDGHFTLSRANYDKSTQIYYEDKDLIRAEKAGIKYEKPLVVSNPGERAFLRLVGNTIHYNRKMNNEIPQEISRTPRLGFLGLRAWAVAYGPSFFEITMGKSKAGSGGVIVGTTRMWAPLTKPKAAGEVSQTLMVQGEYQEPLVNKYYDDRFANTISLAQLIDNDGRGDLSLVVVFKDSSNPIRVNFTGLQIPTLDRRQLLEALPF